MKATFFSTQPRLQMELMLAQNIVWLCLLVFFRPYTAIPFKGGPLERFFAEAGGELALKGHWSAGNIVEAGMACGTVALAAIGLTAGEGNAALSATAFFMQLIIVLALIGGGRPLLRVLSPHAHAPYVFDRLDKDQPRCTRASRGPPLVERDESG